MRIAIALLASILAFLQNWGAIASGLVHGAIFFVPHRFVGVFVAELLAIWAGFYLWRRARLGAMFLAAWVALVLVVTGRPLPLGQLGVSTDKSERLATLDRIKVLETSVEALKPGIAGERFALTFTLEFPETGRYRMYPASAGSGQSKIVGTYFRNLYPKMSDEGATFEAGQPYAFTVVFDTGDTPIDFATDKAHIQVADDKGPLALRTIDIGLEAVPAALTANPRSSRADPFVPENKVLALTERSVRLSDLALHSATVKTGEALVFTYNITNIGESAVAIPHQDFGNVVGITYAWEPLSESAKKTQSGVSRNGNKFAAGGEFFMRPVSSAPDRLFAPGEKEPKVGRIRPYQPLLPGEYRLHVTLFSRLSTFPGPAQALAMDFSVVP